MGPWHLDHCYELVTSLIMEMRVSGTTIGLWILGGHGLESWTTRKNRWVP